jgi:TonB family protein
MFADMAAPAPPAAVKPILPSIQPEPEPEPAPVPEKPAPVPEPKKEKPKPEPRPEPKKEKPKPDPKPEPEKPKWKPKEVVPQNRRVTRETTTKPQAVTQPRRDLSQLKNTLNSLAGNPDDAYYGTIQPRFYAVWQQPATAPYGTKATATIRVNSSGQVTYSVLSTPSGNPAFDQSVQTALRNIGRLPAPPKNLINRDILIYFELD